MAEQFEMDPDATRSGLMDAGIAREQAAGSAIPTPPPAGRYTAGLLCVSGSLLAESTARVGSAAAQGLGATASSTAAAETVEASNTRQLET
jgi:hypothetical protein